jgi:hypothetical protein
LVSPDGKDHNRIDYILIDEAIRMHWIFDHTGQQIVIPLSDGDKS